MKLIEADGKDILKRYEIPVPKGAFLGIGEPYRDLGLGDEVIVKAQVLEGGRGKAGLVRAASQSEVAATVAAIREELQHLGKAPIVLLEERLPISDELYLGCVIDDVRQWPVLLFSARGGVDVETGHEEIRRLPVDPLKGLYPHQVVPFLQAAGVTGPRLGPLARLAARTMEAFLREDAELIEINPLIITSDERAVAADAKVVIDDNALHRRPELAETLSARLAQDAKSDLERRAAEKGFIYIDLDGDVAVLSGGAGLGMATMDMLGDAGFRPANFTDVSGGVGPEVFSEMARTVFLRAHDPQVHAIVFHINISGVPLKRVIDGFLAAMDEFPHGKALFTCLSAGGTAAKPMSVEDAVTLLRQRGILAFSRFADLLSALVEEGHAPARGALKAETT